MKQVPVKLTTVNHALQLPSREADPGKRLARSPRKGIEIVEAAES